MKFEPSGSETPKNYFSDKMASPIGELTLICSDEGITAVLWEKEIPGRIRDFCAVSNKQHPILLQTRQELNEYFAGARKIFNVPIDVVGTPFQKKAWKELQAIPYGETRTYGQQAIRLGGINLSRAVGGANHRNPLSIIVPCHRVIGSTGSLTGFAGGLEAKAFLLELEGERTLFSGHTRP